MSCWRQFPSPFLCSCFLWPDMDEVKAILNELTAEPKNILHNLMRWVSAGLAGVAVLSGIFLLLPDAFPHFVGPKHKFSSPTPLLLIRLANVPFQPIPRP